MASHTPLGGTGDASVRRQASSSVERQQGSLAIRSPKLNQVIQVGLHDEIYLDSV